jgi:hypothetical protein
MSRNRSGTPALPPQDSLSFKVVDYFHGHPDEVLTQRDVAKKFGVAPSSVDSMLMPAVQSGHLVRAQSDEYGVVFRLPPKRTGFPKPFTPSLKEAVRRNREARRAPVRIDFAAIKIEKDVPLIDPLKRVAHWDQLFDKMAVGDSFSLPLAARDAVAHARTHYRERLKGTKNFAVRKVDESRVRVWRIE